MRDELEKLREERRYMENDLADTRIRWHSLKEEKGKVANILRDVERVEAELDRLTEEKSQVDLDEKVISLSLQIWKSWWGSKVLLREYLINKSTLRCRAISCGRETLCMKNCLEMLLGDTLF